MSESEQKVVQYLSEARASEIGLVSVLRSQIAMTEPGSYRDALEKHLGETRTHASRIQERLGELGEVRNPFQALVGFTETIISEMLALSKTPFDLMRGSSGEEKVLKNAKDACATEALEIATYSALERLAIKVGDEQTAGLAASIRGDEERMLKSIMLEIPKLTDAVVTAEIEGHPSSELSETVAADGTGKAARQPGKAARQTQARPKRTTREAGNTPGATQGERGRKAAVAAEEPWPGYDELTVAEIEAVLNEGDDQRAQDILVYERAHKNRPEVVQSALVPARFWVSTLNR